MYTSIEIVKKLLMLDHIDPEDAVTLASFVTSKTYRKHQVISDGESRYLLGRGIIKSVMITNDGNPVFKRFYYKDQSFGSLFSSHFREQLITASDEATVFRIRGSEVLKYFNDRMILSAYHAQVEDQSQSAEHFYLDLMTKDVRERLVHFFERLIRDCTHDGLQIPIIIDCPLSIEEIGQSIFATRQSVSFHLSGLQRIGWVQKHKNSLQFATRTFEQFKFHAVVK